MESDSRFNTGLLAPIWLILPAFPSGSISTASIPEGLHAVNRAR
jgi:hypothetical protein